MKTSRSNALSSSRQGSAPPSRAFTLLELLVVLAAVAILGCLALGAASTSRTASQALQCVQNGNQMIKAWTLYAVDNQGLLAPNVDDGHYGNWLGGMMSGSATYNDPTNYGLINNTYAPAAAGYKGSGPSAIGTSYLKDYKFAKCPADPSNYGGGGVDPSGAQTNESWIPRVRSYSMSQAVGTQSNNKLPVTGPWLTGSYGANNPAVNYNTYGKLSPWKNPGPSNTAVILDEDPYSINDAACATDESLPDELIDWPASFHLKACGFAFADGHSIIKHWVDPRTFAIWYTHNNGPQSQPNNPDIEWLRLHTSGNASGTPLPLSTTPSP